MSFRSMLLTDLEEKMKTVSLELEQAQNELDLAKQRLVSAKKTKAPAQFHSRLSVSVSSVVLRSSSLMNKLSKYRKDCAILILHIKITCLSVDKEEAHNELQLTTDIY